MKMLSDRTFLAAVFFICMALRIWGLADNSTYRGDEGFQVPAAINYMQTGHEEPDNWIHPPLKSILMYTSIKIFGNNPYGWRMMNVILGSLSVILLYMLARELFEDRKIALFGALFLALDPLHIFFSRSNFQEIPAACFFLLGLYFTLRHLRGSLIAALVAGLCIGLANSMKWYYVFAWVLVLGYVAYQNWKWHEWSFIRGLFVAATLIAIPLGVYMLTYFKWFERGYGIIEFFEMHIDMIREMSSMRLAGFKPQLDEIGPSVNWFIKPMFYAFPLDIEAAWPRVLVIMNSPPVWMLVLPSAAYAVYKSVTLRESNIILLLMIFLAIYPQFLLSSRPVFIYSSITVLPFAVLLVAYALVDVVGRMKDSRRALITVVAVFLIWSAIVYPMATGKPSPPGIAGLFLEQ